VCVCVWSRHIIFTAGVKRLGEACGICVLVLRYVCVLILRYVCVLKLRYICVLKLRYYTLYICLTEGVTRLGEACGICVLILRYIYVSSYCGTTRYIYA
jgi:ribosomal protein L7Ae-like RNA K-turn-binding protein